MEEKENTHINKIVWAVLVACVLLLPMGVVFAQSYAELPAASDRTGGTVGVRDASASSEATKGAADPASASSIPTPSLKSILASEDGGIVLEWDAVPGATVYEVARAAGGSESFENIGRTAQTTYRDEGGEAGQTYSYKVRAITAEGESNYSGAWEKTKRRAPERIAFVGDSVMSGFAVYGVLTDPRAQSFAEVSRRMATVNQQDMPAVLNYNPDRVYLMVGTNDCVGGKSDEEIAAMMIDYIDMLDKLHAANPSIEIVAMGIGPTRSDRVDNETVARFNNQLQKVVGERPFVWYYDTGKMLRDTDGQLRADYAAADGIHWSKAAYEAVYGDLMQFSASW
ncbi:MAG: hypothetical protein IJV04_05435 [Lachnospiraceae bacterium]|nr:hypothetical protein [Lachnospiraceae bacterium]